ncbi:HPP family protein [Bacterioplanoides sp.]|uniref:CBS domain-containing protein n=1 Tax=Bacterioplanoides sp. TaxID=2066072 RepID=UPI003AFF7D6B
MSLIVFDMGRRVETPVTPEKFRINPVYASAATSAVGSAADAYERQQDHYASGGESQHQPQAVAYVADIMQRKVQYIYSDAPLRQAWEMMQNTGFHHIPVVSDDLTVCAMLSDRDLLNQSLSTHIDWHDNVLTLASRPVLCIGEYADIRQCARTLLEYRIGALPVINEQNLLSGIITRTDILRVLSHYGPMELWA